MEFVDAKGVVEALLEFLAVGEARWIAASDLAAFHPQKTARVELQGVSLGVVGALHPATAEELELHQPCWLFELDLERLLEYCPARGIYTDLPRFPAVVRDVAVVAEDSFASDQVIRFVRAWNEAEQLIEDVYLFDQYVGPPIPAGKKSLAYSISYRARDRTLTDAEVNEVHAQLIKEIEGSLGVELR